MIAEKYNIINIDIVKCFAMADKLEQQAAALSRISEKIIDQYHVSKAESDDTRIIELKQSAIELNRVGKALKLLAKGIKQNAELCNNTQKEASAIISYVGNCVLLNKNEKTKVNDLSEIIEFTSKYKINIEENHEI